MAGLTGLLRRLATEAKATISELDFRNRTSICIGIHALLSGSFGTPLSITITLGGSLTLAAAQVFPGWMAARAENNGFAAGSCFALNLSLPTFPGSRQKQVSCKIQSLGYQGVTLLGKTFAEQYKHLFLNQENDVGNDKFALKGLPPGDTSQDHRQCSLQPRIFAFDRSQKPSIKRMNVARVALALKRQQEFAMVLDNDLMQFQILIPKLVPENKMVARPIPANFMAFATPEFE